MSAIELQVEKKDDEKHGFYENMNRADINSVNLGMWVTYKCLSNYKFIITFYVS